MVKMTVEVTYLDGETEIIACNELNIKDGVLHLYNNNEGSYYRDRHHAASYPLTSIRRYVILEDG